MEEQDIPPHVKSVGEVLISILKKVVPAEDQSFSLYISQSIKSSGLLSIKIDFENPNYRFDTVTQITDCLNNLHSLVEDNREFDDPKYAGYLKKAMNHLIIWSLGDPSSNKAAMYLKIKEMIVTIKQAVFANDLNEEEIKPQLSFLESALAEYSPYKTVETVSELIELQTPGIKGYLENKDNLLFDVERSLLLENELKENKFLDEDSTLLPIFSTISTEKNTMTNWIGGLQSLAYFVEKIIRPKMKGESAYKFASDRMIRKGKRITNKQLGSAVSHIGERGESDDIISLKSILEKTGFSIK